MQIVIRLWVFPELIKKYNYCPYVILHLNYIHIYKIVVLFYFYNVKRQLVIENNNTTLFYTVYRYIKNRLKKKHNYMH